MENINDDFIVNFEKFDHALLTHHRTKYDYDSIMHYEAFSFSKNDKPTIIPLVKPNLVRANSFSVEINKNDFLIAG